MSINQCMMSGRLVEDPELRKTPSDVSVVVTRIAVDDGWGENKKTYFPTVVFWRQKADFLSTYARKGDKITFVGRYTERTYEKDGVKKYTKEFIATDVELQSSKDNSSSKPSDFKSSVASQSNGVSNFDDYEEFDDDDGNLPF